MKTNVVKLILSVSLVLISIVSFAQQRGQLGTPEERATRQTTHMKEALNLSADQETSVADINLKYARQMQSIIETGERNLKTARSAKAIMKSKDKELKEVLNKDQFTQYQTNKEEMISQMKERRKQRS
jgi:biopolymer transport protein ExbB/TolQ